MSGAYLRDRPSETNGLDAQCEFEDATHEWPYMRRCRRISAGLRAWISNQTGEKFRMQLCEPHTKRLLEEVDRGTIRIVGVR